MISKIKEKGYKLSVIIIIKKLYNYFISLLVCFVTFIPSVCLSMYYILFFFNKKIILVKLDCRKFGHVLQGTEYILRFYKDAQIKLIFLVEIRNEIREIISILKNTETVHSKHLGIFFELLSKFLNNIEVVKPTLQTTKKFLLISSKCNLKLFNQDYFIKQLQDRIGVEKWVTFTVRDSEYTIRHQNYKPEMLRDTYLVTYEKAIKYLLKRNYGVVFINRDIPQKIQIGDQRYYDYNNEKKYNLNKEICLIQNSSLHIASDTSIDLISLYTKVFTCWTNVPLGDVFNHHFMMNSNILPVNHYDLINEEYISIKKYLYLLKKSQELYGASDRLEFKQHKKLGILKIPNTPDEILKAVEESINYSNGNYKLTTEEYNTQKKFWILQNEKYASKLTHKNINAYISRDYVNKHNFLR